MKFSTTFLALLLPATYGFAPAPWTGIKRNVALMESSKVDPDWLAKDMAKAGKSDKEKQDWVAEEMNRMGKAGTDPTEHPDWVAEDMREAGEDKVRHTPALKKEKEKETRTDKIAKDMKKAGKEGASDWVASDMELAGSPDSHSSEQATSWVNKLSRTLDTARDQEYDDIKDDMEKAGKMGSGKNQQIANDMKRLGEAGHYMEQLSAKSHNVSYKLSDWQTKAYDLDEIQNDMKQAGGAGSDYVKHDMEVAGQAHKGRGRVMPRQDKDITDELNKDKENTWVGRDMTDTGKATAGWFPRKEQWATEKKMEELVGEDMKMAGKMTDSWVKDDLENAGHPDTYLNQRGRKETHATLEKEEFMKTRPVKMAPEPTEEELEVGVFEEAEEIEAVLEESIMGEEPELEPEPEHKKGVLRSAVESVKNHLPHHMPWYHEEEQKEKE